MPSTDKSLLKILKAAVYDVNLKEIEDIDANTEISELGLDSVAMMELIGVLEETLSIRIPDEEIAGLSRVGDLLNLIRNRVPLEMKSQHKILELAKPAPGGGAAEGAKFRIVEKFAGRDDFTVDVVDRVEKLDETGIRLVQRIGGVVVFQLEHTWSAGPDGAHYVTVLDLGARSAVITPVNHVLTRRFPDKMVRAWVRHNIEEVGQLEYLLPDLHASGRVAVR